MSYVIVACDLEQMDAPMPRKRHNGGFQHRAIELSFRDRRGVERLMEHVAKASPERPVAIGYQANEDTCTIEFDVIEACADGLSVALMAKPFFRGVA